VARRLKWLLLAGLVAVAAGMAAFLAVGSGDRAGTGGPLSNLGADPTGFSIPINVGQSASVSGPFVVKNTGARPLTLDRVQLVGLQHGLTLRGAYVVPYPQHPAVPRPRSATIGIVTGYGLFREDRSLHGATVAPHAQIAIVLGVTPTRAGRHAWFAVDLTYHDGTHSYTLRTPVAARICAPKATYVGQNSPDCSPPDPLKRH
jgi:hypothetical protein